MGFTQRIFYRLKISEIFSFIKLLDLPNLIIYRYESHVQWIEFVDEELMQEYRKLYQAQESISSWSLLG